MSKTVSRESLHALASLAFETLNTEPDSPSRPECNLEGGASCKLGDLLLNRYGVAREEPNSTRFADRFFEGYTEGVELGLNIAAAILGSALDNECLSKAVNLEIKKASNYWPEGAINKEAA